MGRPGIEDVKEFQSVVGTDVTQKLERVFKGEQLNACSPGKKEDDEKSKRSGPEMWAVSGNSFFPCARAIKALPPAYYQPESSPQGVFVRRIPSNTDKLLHFPDCASDWVIDEIRSFWRKETHFRSHGFMWKRGFLLYGPPGSGKTSTVNIVTAEHVTDGGIVLYIQHPSLGSEALKIIRTIEPKRSLIVVLEDIDAIASNYGESDLLSMLDGEHQVDNVVFIATTNYPERLDHRIVNRPSRFDIIAKIGMPNAEARRLYLLDKSINLQSDPDMADLWVKETEEFSFAHLKELIVSVEVFERPFDESVERLRQMMECKSSSKEFQQSDMGFVTSKQQSQKPVGFFSH